MAEFPLPVLQIWRSRKQVAIQIQLMNIHVSECKYYCLHLVSKYGNMCDRQNWRLHPTAGRSALTAGAHNSWRNTPSSGRGRHWNFDQLQCLGPRPEILDRYISLSCLRWLPTACHERLAYFHWPQWVTWLVTWWVTWSRSPDAGRHIGKFSLWTTLLRFSRSAQISLFSNFTKLGQLFFDNIFFGLTS